MKIELTLSPPLYSHRQLVSPQVAVAVDVLRATSAILAAFSAGVSEVVPLADLSRAEEYHSKGYLLAAEREGVKLCGATCGNSPVSYLSMDLHGRRLAWSSTNGTVAITTAEPHASRLYVGAFANLSSLAARITADFPDSLLILCSGWKGDPSIEDTLFAGALVSALQRSLPDVTLLNDAASASVDLYNLASHDLYSYCLKATHVQRLLRLGCEDDIRWALRTDTVPLVPFFNPQSDSLIL
ncbi:MAG: 2-phosphosulfolactate phosphatase [Bacteroidales bacterium]|nr:2-phosphosulfolactate phosphatase [Bacteroidales bacterium]